MAVVRLLLAMAAFTAAIRAAPMYPAFKDCPRSGICHEPLTRRNEVQDIYHRGLPWKAIVPAGVLGGILDHFIFPHKPDPDPAKTQSSAPKTGATHLPGPVPADDPPPVLGEDPPAPKPSHHKEPGPPVHSDPTTTKPDLGPKSGMTGDDGVASSTPAPKTPGADEGDPEYYPDDMFPTSPLGDPEHDTSASRAKPYSDSSHPSHHDNPSYRGPDSTDGPHSFTRTFHDSGEHKTTDGFSGNRRGFEEGLKAAKAFAAKEASHAYGSPVLGVPVGAGVPSAASRFKAALAAVPLKAVAIGSAGGALVHHAATSLVESWSPEPNTPPAKVVSSPPYDLNAPPPPPHETLLPSDAYDAPDKRALPLKWIAGGGLGGIVLDRILF
ncbi:hypothetical protein V8E36_006282 [Tilletia maclaganii]